MSKLIITRREMLRTATVAAGVLTATGSLAKAQADSPNEKLNIAGIGVGGRGAGDVNGSAHENIVALCDVDEKRAAQTFQRYPDAKQFKDFRKMLDHVEANAPLRRNVTIEDVGNAGAFLCSDLAAGITGEVTYVDGGFNTIGMTGY